MAVVQISRIQVRRGRKNQGTGLPQLASGEIAWAIDAQELYIGNGAVSEGAPAVGNTKILTELDNILDLAGQYEYRVGDSTVVTGLSPNYPVIRSLQERLDETVTVYSFGVTGDGTTDDTSTLQNAINQLFMTTTARSNVGNRVILVLPPGTYKITNTLYIPSYTTIVGAGKDKTIINYIGEGHVFEFVNDSSRPGNFNPSSLTYNNQPKFIDISNLSVNAQTVNKPVIRLDSVRNSKFENIKITGNWGEVVETTNALGGVHFTVFGLITCERNKFINLDISGFTFGVYAKGDIMNNEFIGCDVRDCYQGYRLGRNINGSSDGEIYGPRTTTISGNHFENIKRHGVYVDNGVGNIVQGNEFINVGNNSGGNSQAVYNHVYFATTGNTSVKNYSDRHEVVGGLATTNLSTPYIGEVGGIHTTESFGTYSINMSVVSQPILGFRLPLSSGVTGYEIDYTYKGTTAGQSRRGTITVVIDSANNKAQLSDSYNYTGSENEAVAVNFNAQLLSIGGPTVNTLGIYYTNTSSGNGVLTYSYRTIQ